MVILEAIRGVREHRFSYWDAQIWATARLNQIEVVFSEDFTTDTIVDAVRFVNPFHAEFDWQNLR
jgi:predicted nucleic acid-binding protein